MKLENILELDLKKDFPLLNQLDIAYLDNSATSQRPVSVIEAERDFYLKHNANPLRGLYQLAVEATDIYEEAREAVKDFLHAKATEEIIFTRNTTESLNLVAYAYGLHKLKPGDELVTTIAEHHSNMLPWRMVAAKTGAIVKYIDCAEDGSISEEGLAEVISSKTKIVALAHIGNVMGRLNPVAKAVELAHQVGAVVVLDAAQSAPHLPLDVQALDVDFLAFSGHKALGPMGIGVLYGKQELLEAIPPFLYGGEMINWVSRESQEYAPLPHKFEAGTVNAAAAAGLKAALDYINKLGFDNIAAREAALTELCFEGLRAIKGVKILGGQSAEEHKGIITFTLADVHPHDIAAILDCDGVNIRAGNHCAQPLLDRLGCGPTARVSLMFYNSVADVERFLKSAASIRKRMGYKD